VDASRKLLDAELDAQDARSQPAEVVEFDDIDTIDPFTFAALLAANERQIRPFLTQAPVTQSQLMQALGIDDADAIEIELSAEQMDAVLEGRWTP
jgi:hypothetical protein